MAPTHEVLPLMLMLPTLIAAIYFGYTGIKLTMKGS